MSKKKKIISLQELSSVIFPVKDDTATLSNSKKTLQARELKKNTSKNQNTTKNNSKKLSASKLNTSKQNAQTAGSEEILEPKEKNEMHFRNDFLFAMEGVEVLEKGNGRQYKPSSTVKIQKTKTNPKKEFTSYETANFIGGHVSNFTEDKFFNLRQGKYPHEGILDLHGYTEENAYEMLHFFLKESAQIGRKHVLVITGQGKNSLLGFGFLQRAMPEWLESFPLCSYILAYSTSQPHHGGLGAYYILLSKSK